jgi:acyl carrier protein
MSAEKDSELLLEVIEIVRLVHARPGVSVCADSKILIDLDFDSLKVIELLGELRNRKGTDLSLSSNLIKTLHSPATIAAALGVGQ